MESKISEAVNLFWFVYDRKVLVGWANSILRKRKLAIKNFPGDVSDGVLLGSLFELVTNSPVGKLEPNCKLFLQQVNNLGIVLKKFLEVDVKVFFCDFKLNLALI